MSSCVNFGFLKSAVVFCKLLENPSASNSATRSSTSHGCNGWTSNGSKAIPGQSFKLSVASTTLPPDALAQSAASSATCTSSESGNCNRGANTELFRSTSKSLPSACHPGGVVGHQVLFDGLQTSLSPNQILNRELSLIHLGPQPHPVFGVFHLNLRRPPQIDRLGLAQIKQHIRDHILDQNVGIGQDLQGQYQADKPNFLARAPARALDC